MKKTGQLDAIFYLVYFFAFVLVIVVLGLLWDNIDTAGFGREDYTAVNDTYVSVENVFPNFNYNLVFMFIGIGVAISLSLFLLPSSPALKIVGVLVLLVMILVAAVIGNVFGEFTAAGTDVGDYATTNFGAVQTIFSNYPLMFTLMIAFGIIVLVGKRALSNQ